MRIFHPRLYPALFAMALSVPAAAQTPPPAVITVPAMRGRPPRVLSDTMGTPFELEAPAKRVFDAVIAVYADFKIPTEVSDSLLLQVGNPSFDRRGDLAGRRMTAYLDCGQDMTVPRADFHRIDISLFSFIKPTGSATTTLRSVMLAGAANVGVRGTVACQSTGEFERRIYEQVLKKLGPP